MSDLLEKSAEILAPQDVMGKTLRELMADPSVEINRKGNILTLNTGREIITIRPCSNDGAQEQGNVTAENANASAGPSAAKRNRGQPITQLKSKIVELRAAGKTQREVAEILGTTQANISKIEREMKKEAQEVADTATVKSASKAPNASAAIVAAVAPAIEAAQLASKALGVAMASTASAASKAIKESAALPAPSDAQ